MTKRIVFSPVTDDMINALEPSRDEALLRALLEHAKPYADCGDDRFWSPEIRELWAEVAKRVDRR